jgi:hypothetical protein
MRMKGARKNAQGMITEAGNRVVYVAGYPAIMGLQPLYWKDPELARRARIPADKNARKKLALSTVSCTAHGSVSLSVFQFWTRSEDGCGKGKERRTAGALKKAAAFSILATHGPATLTETGP